MTQRSWFWGGTSTGDAGLPAPYGAPYSDDMFSDIFSYLFTRDRTVQGVVASSHTSYSGSLACTNTNSTVTVGTGIGICDGKVFSSDATTALDFTGDGVFYVVMRKSWSSQTVRLALVSSITQSDGTTWDVPLYKYVRSGSVVTEVTDMRTYALYGNKTRVITHDPLAMQAAADTAAAAVDAFFYLPYDYYSNLAVSMEFSGGTGNVYGSVSLEDAYIQPGSAPGTGVYYSGTITNTLHATLYTTSAAITAGSTDVDLPIERGNLMAVRFIRLGTNVLDTCTASVNVRFIITYESME